MSASSEFALKAIMAYVEAAERGELTPEDVEKARQFREAQADLHEALRGI